jgi:hypothetical protein
MACESKKGALQGNKKWSTEKIGVERQRRIWGMGTKTAYGRKKDPNGIAFLLCLFD